MPKTEADLFEWRAPILQSNQRTTSPNLPKVRLFDRTSGNPRRGQTAF